MRSRFPALIGPVQYYTFYIQLSKNEIMEIPRILSEAYSKLARLDGTEF